MGALALGGCGLYPVNVSLSDPAVQPLLEAMEKVDRAGYGFTPVTTNAKIRLELRSFGAAHDAMLHVYEKSSRTIAFRKTESGYRWIGEQERHQGPKWYQTRLHTLRESMTIQFQTERVDGIPTNQLFIRYHGGDTNLASRELTLVDVGPVLEAWRTSIPEPRPPDAEWQHPEEDFDPAFALFVLFMLGALLVGCALALIVGVACTGVVAILLPMGIASTALLVGLLRNSVSTGFRVLFIQLGASVGALGGAMATAVYNWLANADWQSPFRWAAGVTIGLSLGILAAWLFNLCWTRIVSSLKSKLEKSEN